MNPFLVLAGIALVFLILLQIRNLWVYTQKTELNRFKDGVYVGDEYLSYHEMMLRFWIWDVEKLKKPEVKEMRADYYRNQIAKAQAALAKMGETS